MFKKTPSSGPFSSALQKINERKYVWDKAHIVPGQDPDFIRADDFGNIISYSQYGNSASEYGWEIDFIPTQSFEDPSDASNVRPLHCRSKAAQSQGLAPSFQ